MNQENPYAAPTSDPIAPQTEQPGSKLAPLGDRFLGAIIDGLIGAAVGIPIWAGLYFLGTYSSFSEIGTISLWITLLVGILHFVLYMAVQWMPLQATGQTIGKKVAKTRIATMNGDKPTMTDLVFKRYAFSNLISMIPFAGGIIVWVDILMIFKTDRRCLHDLIAGTQVLSIRNVS